MHNSLVALQELGVQVEVLAAKTRREDTTVKLGLADVLKSGTLSSRLE